MSGSPEKKKRKRNGAHVKEWSMARGVGKLCQQPVEKVIWFRNELAEKLG